jgi:hypothetical protein
MGLYWTVTSPTVRMTFRVGLVSPSLPTTRLPAVVVHTPNDQSQTMPLSVNAALSNRGIMLLDGRGTPAATFLSPFRMERAHGINRYGYSVWSLLCRSDSESTDYHLH